MSLRELAITSKFSWPGNPADLEKEFSALVQSRGGTVNDIAVSPSSLTLHEAGINPRVIKALARHDKCVDTLDQLQDMTEEDVLRVRGIGWSSYYRLVVTLADLADHQVRLKDAPEFDDMLELLNIPLELYLELRSTNPDDHEFWRIPKHRTFRNVTEVTELDFVGLRQLIGYGADTLQRKLPEGRHLAPLLPHWTIRDLLRYPGSDIHYFLELEEGGLDIGMRLIDITRQYLVEQCGQIGNKLSVSILLSALSDCGFKYGDDAEIRAEIRERHEQSLAGATV